MSNSSFVNVRVSTVVDICARFDVKEEARQLIRAGMTPREFAAALVANRQYVTGIDFIAHALSPREGVWWGCLCLQHALEDDWSEGDKAACKAAVQWVMQPTEGNRAFAQTLAEAALPVSAAGQLVMAASQTRGNVTLDLSTMPPGTFLPAKAVAAAVKMACAKAVPARILETQRLFVELGSPVVDGRLCAPAIGSRVRGTEMTAK